MVRTNSAEPRPILAKQSTLVRGLLGLPAFSAMPCEAVNKSAGGFGPLRTLSSWALVAWSALYNRR